MKTLTTIQNELKVPKGNFNSFGKYKYRSAEDILEAIKPILLKNKATLHIFDELVFMGAKYFIKSNAVLNCDTETISVSGFAELSEHKGMSAEQCTGTASSYARKYALNGLFLIDETEADADSIAPVKAEEKPKPAFTIEKFQAALDKGFDIAKIKETHYVAPDIEAKYLLFSKAAK